MEDKRLELKALLDQPETNLTEYGKQRLNELLQEIKSEEQS